MDRFLILRRFIGVLQGTIRNQSFVWTQSMKGVAMKESQGSKENDPAPS